MKNNPFMKSVDDAATPVVGFLRKSGFEEDAAEIERLIIESKTEKSVIAALTQLRAMCHIKWLGDVPVENIDWNDWLHMLDDLKQSVDRRLSE